MRFGRQARFAAMAAAALVIASGCGGNEAADSVDATAATTTTAPATGDDVTTGGEVVIGVEANPATIDFVGNNGGAIDSATDYTFSMMYEGLTALGADGGSVPLLAESVEHNDDYTVWTAKLREGVTFTDGTPLNAAAVVESYRFRADPANCKCAASYEGMTFEATDDMTVQVTLTEARTRLDETRLTDAIASPATLKPGYDRNAEPVGTGPFKLTDRAALQFERNENYWRKDEAGKALPYLDGIRLAPISDPSVRLAALRKGEIQVMEVLDGPTLNLVSADDEFTVDRSGAGGTTLVIANTRSGPASDQEVRDALALSVDREALAQSYAESASVPAFSFFTDEFTFDITGEFPDRDLDKAKEMVESIKARLGDDALKIKIVCAKIPEAEALLPVAVNQLKEAGFDATLTFLDVGEYAAQVLGGGGSWDLACSRVPPIDASPADLSNYLVTGRGPNVAKYSNPEIDALFDQEQKAVDLAERTEIFQKVSDAVVKDKPYVPLLFSQVAAVARKEVQGVRTSDRFWPTEVDVDRIWLKQG